MRKTISKFWCDNVGCNKEITKEAKSKDIFPFDSGWVQLNMVNIGVPKNSNHNLIDQPAELFIECKDFCSTNCMFHHIDREMKKAAETIAMPNIKEHNFDEEIDMMANIRQNQQRPNERVDILPDSAPKPPQEVPKKRGMSAIFG